MFLSILVPIYNTRAYVEDLVRQLALLAKKTPDIEFIFVDDASTDDSLLVLRAAILKFGLPGTEIVEHAANRGLSAARNTGLTKASGDYIWFIDSDDLIVPEAAIAAIEGLAKNPADILAFEFISFDQRQFPRIVVDQEGARVLSADALRPLRHAKRKIAPDQTHTEKSKFVGPFLADRLFFSWAMIVRRDLACAHPYPEGLIYEDQAVTPLLAVNAKSLRYLPHPIVLYRQGHGGLSSRTDEQAMIDGGRCLYSILPAFERMRSELPADTFESLGGTLLETTGERLHRLRIGSLRVSWKMYRQFLAERRDLLRVLDSGYKPLLKRVPMRFRADLKRFIARPRLFLLSRFL